MSRKTKTKAKSARPLTVEQLADMDAKHEMRKAEMIGKRGVTAAVTEAPKTLEITEAEFDHLLQNAMQFGMAEGEARGFNAGLKSPRSAAEARVKDQTPAVARILQEVFVETRKAIGKYASQTGPHEGYAVLKEEVDELWDEIKADRGKQRSARTEAIQIAAMAVRYVLDNDPH